MSFDKAFDELLISEGVLSMDRNDPGNWTGGAVGRGELRGTKYGISAAAYPSLDIPALTIEECKFIYKRDYWLAAKCDKLSPAVGVVVFDAAVNQGVKRAIQMLQSSIGVTVDGVIGPQTIARANLAPRTAVVAFTTERILHYASLPAWKTYGKGWTARAIRSAIGALP